MADYKITGRESQINYKTEKQKKQQNRKINYVYIYLKCYFLFDNFTLIVINTCMRAIYIRIVLILYSLAYILTIRFILLYTIHHE